MAKTLSRAVERLRFGPPTTHVYNPLEYAWEPHSRYLEKFGVKRPREVILLGMNPGPWGMAQTGVPFGDVKFVEGWLGVTGRVRKPELEHPLRPVVGFSCRRSEVSGARLWGLARDRFGIAASFFDRFFVANYCPLVFMEESGRNRTPDKLPVRERDALFEACDRALRDMVEHLRPRLVVGVGAFAEARARAALPGSSVSVGRIPHPSPASPKANLGWAVQAVEALEGLGVSWD